MIGTENSVADQSNGNQAIDTLLAVAPPPLSPDSELSSPPSEMDDFAAFQAAQPEEPGYAKASWLDAMPLDPFADDGDYDGIAAVNSDDNGLYRMFVGVSP